MLARPKLARLTKRVGRPLECVQGTADDGTLASV